MIALQDIEFAYADSAWRLCVPALVLEASACVGIVGPNGSGKSTLLRLAAGIMRPEAGRVMLDGRDLNRLNRRELARRIGYLPQENAMLYDYTVVEVTQMGRYPHLQGMGLLAARDKAAVDTALQTVGLSDLASRTLSRLSGGERRRALIASVLAQEPELLLLDEPTAGLDIHHAAEVFKVVRDLSNRGMGVIMVTHDLNLVSLYCDRLIVMRGGRLFAEGSPGEALSTDNVSVLYGTDFLVQPHPETGRPMVLPMGPPDPASRQKEVHA